MVYDWFNRGGGEQPQPTPTPSPELTPEPTAESVASPEDEAMAWAREAYARPVSYTHLRAHET